MTARLDSLRSASIEPFAYGYSPTHTVAEASRLPVPSAEPISLAGRLISVRRHGRLVFADLADSTGFIQLMLRTNVLADGAQILPHLRTGDFLGATGTLTYTTAGELSLAPASLTMLAAATLSPPFAPNPRQGFASAPTSPSSPDALTDPETCARSRHLDLAVHPDTRTRFAARSLILRTTRSFLDARRYQEVETPILQPIYGGAAARPFTTHYHSLDETRYLRIAPELYLRRLLIGGLERVYEIARCFRNEGLDRSHTPEFTMLEAYEAYADYSHMMTLTEDLLRLLATTLYGRPSLTYQGQAMDFATPFARLDFCEALSTRLGFDVLAAPTSQLAAALPSSASSPSSSPASSANHPADLLDALFAHYIEPTLSAPTFVINHPLILSPLARTHRQDPRLAERFELYLGGFEVANAYTELCDPVEIHTRLANIAAHSASPLDAAFAEAATYGLPPSAGLGIGLDRLVMVLTDTPHIRDVQLFPPMRTASP